VRTAQRLIDIVTNLRRKDAMRLGQKRANALIGLADATPEHVFHGVSRVWSARKVTERSTPPRRNGLDAPVRL